MTRYSSPKTHFLQFLLSLGIWLLFLTFFQSPGIAQTVVLPRAGYPYCQPFTGNAGGDPNNLPFTVAKGDEVIFGNPLGFNPRPIFLTGQALRLTTTEENLRGYVFVDLPFSSVYGIKTSFEYFVHSPGNENGLGDGLSFFLFDGTINAADFEIGGVGGSLGYAPHGSDNGNYNMGGLKGGYMGIGFDILGNFGNYQEKKYGGYHDQNQFNFSTQESDKKFYPDAVTIRGPVNVSDTQRRNGSPPMSFNPLPSPYFDSYQFVSGKITSYVVGFPYLLPERVSRGSGDLFANPAHSSLFLPAGEMFRLGSGLVPNDINCANRPIGYRKVFIDLRPTGNPAVPYSITVDMLVDNIPNPINILSNVPYPYPAPEDLKLGFSASTGSGAFSTFDIRNVTVEVSSIDEGLAPNPPELTREVCMNDQTEFEFEVDLPAENSFITCIQLFEVDPGPADNSGSSSDQFDCGLSGNCADKCLEANRELTIPGRGTLVAELGELTQGPGGNFETERKIAKLRFEPVAGFVGTFTAYYQVIDNYGLQSDGTLITITVNPEPQLIADGALFDPTCDGQNDGAIREIIVGDLVSGFTYTWLDDSNNPIPVGNQTFSSTPSGNYQEATFGLENINLGTYTLEITNPSVESACSLVISKTLDQESGTPVIIVDPITEICEETPITYTPQVSPIYTNNVSVPPIFLWYSDPDRANPIVTNSNQLIVNGNTITTGQITVGGPGDGALNIASLPEGTYTFYVEVDDTDFPTGGNFCLERNNLEMVELTVFPALQATISETPDLCGSGEGVLLVTFSGGQGTPTFSLFDDSDNQVSQNSTGEFTGLFPGDYSVEIETLSPTCFLSISGKVEGPDQPFALTEGSSQNASCNEDNGALIFSLSGGNLPYKSLTINGTPITIVGDTYTFTDLSPGPYTIIATDDRDCQEIVQLEVIADEPSAYGTTSDQICEGETATVSPLIITQSSSVPSYSWYSLNGGTYTQINDGSVDGAVTFNLDGDNNLSVSGLLPQTEPYVFYLEVTGDKVCPQGYIPTEILVFPVPPQLTAPIINNTSCNGGSDGSIQVQIDEGDLSDFEYALSGSNGVNISYSSNSGLFTGLPAGTYDLSMRGGGGCEVFLSGVTITEPPIFTLAFNSKIDATCAENNGELTFTIGGGTPDADGSYQITVNGADIAALGTDAIVGVANDYTISNLAPGNYLIEAEDNNGCIVSGNEVILETETPGFIVEDIEVCEGQQAVLTPEVLSIPNGRTPVFSWYYEDPQNSGQYLTIQNGDVVDGITYSFGSGERLDISGLQASGSPYTYYVSAIDAGICGLSPKPVTVTISDVPALRVSNPSTICDPNGTIDLSNYIEGFDPGIYDYIVESPSGEAMQISELSQVSVSGDYRVSSARKGTNCWNQPQRISVLIADTELIAHFQYEVILDPATVILNGEVQILEDVRFEDLTEGNTILWNWDFGDGSTSNDQNPTHQFQEKGTYTVNLSTIDDKGCQSEYQIVINVSNNFRVMVPNAFTPDGSKNQMFKPYFRGIASMEFYIFNTWGELIYESKSIEDAGWDGTLNGTPTPNGNYVYRLSLITRSGEKVDKSGVFVLIR